MKAISVNRGIGMLVAAAAVAAMITSTGCYTKYKRQSMQAEAKTNLSAIFTATVAYFGENEMVSTKFKDIGFEPWGETKYSLYLSCEDVIPSDATGYKECPEVVKKFFSERCEDVKDMCHFRAAAVGNLDKDETLDIWVMDHQHNLKNLVNDVTD